MPATTAMRDAYAEQERIVAAAVREAAEVWGNLDPGAFTASWVNDRIGDRLLVGTARAQELAAISADAYTDLILAEQEIEAEADGSVNASALSGVASDGRDLDTLLLHPLIQTTKAQATGMTVAEALTMGLNSLVRIVGTQVQDAGRASTALGVAARPGVGYVRLVNPGACSRCIILAGRFYRWSSGFQRHPLCGCRNIPAAEDTQDLTSESDPMTHFNSLTEAEQNKAFTKAGAESIRLGADINRVVNSRRGALGLTAPGRLTDAERKTLRGGRDIGRLDRTDVFGRQLSTTTEATTARTDVGRRLNGKSPRLMPSAILEIAESREDAVNLLRRFGYIL